MTRLGLGGASIGGLFRPVADDDAIATVRPRLGPRASGSFDVGAAVRLRRRRAADRARPSRPGRATSTSCRRRSAGSSGRRPRSRPAPTSTARRSTAGRTPSTRTRRPPRSCSTTAPTASVARSRRASSGSASTGSTSPSSTTPTTTGQAAIGGAYPALAPAPRGGRDPGDRRRDEPVGDARPVRPRGRHRRLPARRPLHAARPGRASTSCCPLCVERGIAVLVGGVMNSGVLADPRPGAAFNYRPGAARRRRAGPAARGGLRRATASRSGPRRSSSRSPIRRSPALDRRRPDGSTTSTSTRRSCGAPIPADLWDELRPRA